MMQLCPMNLHQPVNVAWIAVQILETERWYVGALRDWKIPFPNLFND